MSVFHSIQTLVSPDQHPRPSQSLLRGGLMTRYPNDNREEVAL